MSDTTSRRFTPASMQDFTSAARDIAAAYRIKLSSAQENLARLYGYEDFHEVRAHLAKQPSPGPYSGEASIGTAIARMTGNGLKERDGSVIWPIGRRGLEDLALYDRPHDRRAWMRFQEAIDRELDPEFVALETNMPIDEYATFIVEDAQYIDGHQIEGKFGLSAIQGWNSRFRVV